MKYFIHKSAEVSPKTVIGINCKIWHYSHIRENAEIGDNTTIGQGVYIDHDVKIGDNCKIQNNSSLYYGLVIEDGVFIGPHVIFANDKYPRAINEFGVSKTNSDWTVGSIRVCKGASIGAGSVILPNVVIGEYAIIGAGSVVSKNVKSYTAVFGNPAVFRYLVDKNGHKVEVNKD